MDHLSSSRLGFRSKQAIVVVAQGFGQLTTGRWCVPLDDSPVVSGGLGPAEFVLLGASTVALAAYVYLAGWLVTSARLSAARLPVDAPLPIVGDKVVFTSGLQMVPIKAVVFGAMCAVAYAVHAWTWTKRAPESHRILTTDRASARKEAHDEAAELAAGRNRIRTAGHRIRGSARGER
jgi:hypothetical protein